MQGLSTQQSFDHFLPIDPYQLIIIIIHKARTSSSGGTFLHAKQNDALSKTGPQHPVPAPL